MSGTTPQVSVGNIPPVPPVQPPNGQDTEIQNAATSALEENVAAASHDPAAKLNTGFPEGAAPYSNLTVNYKFKAPRKDKDGKAPTDKFGKEIPTRPPVTVTFPVPTWFGVQEFVKGEQKNRDWLLDILQDVVKDAVKEQVYDEANPVNEQSTLNIDVLSLDYLVNVPKSERTGRGIPKEIWEEWSKDYIEIMTAAGQRNAEKIGNAAEAFTKRLFGVRSNKPLVKFLLSELNQWATLTNNLEEYSDIYEFLKKKANDYINTDESAQMDNFQ
jgi:hypothetical protein